MKKKDKETIECDAYMTSKPEKCNKCLHLKMDKYNLHYCDIDGRIPKKEDAMKIRVKIGEEEIEVEGSTKNVTEIMDDFYSDVSRRLTGKKNITKNKMIQLHHWEAPNFTIDTQYGTITYVVWLQKEKMRIITDLTRQAEIRKHRNKIALFVNDISTN